MKLSVESSIMSNRYGDIRAFDMIKAAGFDAVDYSFYDRAADHPIMAEGYREYARQLRGHLDEIGLVCNQAHAPLGYMKYGGKFDLSDPGFAAIVRSVEAAALLGAKAIVVHGLWPFGMPPVPQEDVAQFNVDFYKSLVPYCEKNGICVAVENLMRYDTPNKCYCESVATTPEMLRNIVESASSPYIVACLDVGHATLAQIHPEDFALGLGGHMLKAVHMHDTDYIEDLHTMPFVGNIRWISVMKALRKIGYEGDFTFEILEYLKRVPDDLLPEALKFAHTVGRYLIAKFETAEQ